MRCIIREQPYERLLASGQFVFYKEGKLTYAREEWRLTDVTEGYRNLRIDSGDLNISGSGSLYHLVINPAGEPERLKGRYFGPGNSGSIDIHLESKSVAIYAEAGGKRFEHELVPRKGYLLLFPSVAWLGFLVANNRSRLDLSAVSFSVENSYLPLDHSFNIEESGKKTVPISGFDVRARTFQASWKDQRCILSIDRFDLAIEASYLDGRVAIESRYIRHLDYQS